MASEIVSFKDDSGETLSFSAQDIRQRVCPNATDSELAMCLALCKAQHLNPFTREVYLVKYGNQPANLITSYHVFNKRACRMQDYDGIESGVVIMRDGRIEHRKGSAVYKALKEQLLGGWAKVYSKARSHPVEVELALDNFSTGRSNWAKMPGLMIEKCAKATAWRTAYPSEFSGMYCGEEMEQAGARPVEVQAEPEPKPVDLQPLRDLFPAFREALDIHNDEAVALVCEAVKAESVQAMTEAQVRKAVSYMEEETAAALAAEPVNVEGETENLEGDF